MKEMKKKKISIIIPTCNEEDNVELLATKLFKILEKFDDFEIIFIDDGSTDRSLEVIKKLRKKNNKIRFLSFSRNFGHQYALRAGLDYATGDCVISLDADMQQPPELIIKMIEKWIEGYDVVYTARKDDPKLGIFKKLTSDAFYKVFNIFADTNIPKGAADFRLLDKAVVDVMRDMKESDLFVRGAIPWLGFKQISLEYDQNERRFGETKYTLKKMMGLAMSGITGFSIKPLRFATILGFVFAIIAFIYGAYAVYIRLFTQYSISGWASVLSAILFMGGVQLLMIGILGEYIGKIFIESKKRPNYIIKDKSE